MKKILFAVAIVVGLILSGCSRMENNQTLKQSVQGNISKVNDAVSVIGTSKGFQLLTVNGDVSKSGTGYADSITFDLVKGIYDYSPDTLFIPHMSYIPYRIFKKTGTSDNMVVNMPQKIVFHPKYLFGFYHAHDSAYNHNNFTITATDYHNYYSWANRFDYKLMAGFTLNNENMGSLAVADLANSFSGRSYSSKYTFKEGYNIDIEFTSGDTTTSSFALSDSKDVLLKETTIFTGTQFHRWGERQYILDIGNVEIKKTTGVDSIQVYLDGVLQKNAAARVVDSTGSTGSICHHRDLQLKFDDGTTANLSDLLKPALTTLRSLVDSMNSMYFARNIVDYISYSIYYHNKILYRP